MFAFIEIALAMVWLLLIVPTAFAFIAWRRRRNRGEGEPMGGCLALAIGASCLIGLLAVIGLITDSVRKRPATLVKDFLGIVDAQSLRDLDGAHISLGIDYEVYIYFEAEPSLVEGLIRDGGFEAADAGLRYFDHPDQLEAPPIPRGRIEIYRRENPDNRNLETLVTDSGHRRVWFVSVDY